MMHGQAQVLTPKQILAEKISLREKQAKLLLRKKQKQDRLAMVEDQPKPTDTGPEKIILTPEMAVDLLEHNSLNRPIIDSHVHRIARQIIDGKWRYNGDTIKVADTGDVLDGQHRLWAVIEAKRPVETIIVYGIAKDAFATIDTIRRHRSGGDTLALNGVTRYRNIVSASLQWLLRWQGTTEDKPMLTQFRAPQYRIENSDIEAASAAHPAMVNAVERAMKLRSLTNASVLAFFYYVLSNRDSELAERMMVTLEDPAAIARSDPFYKLREYFHSDHLKRKEPIYTIAMMIKAANLASRGEKSERLLWNNQGIRAEPFPTLKV